MIASPYRLLFPETLYVLVHAFLQFLMVCRMSSDCLLVISLEKDPLCVLTKRCSDSFSTGRF